MSARQIFRKEALEKLSSPEELDRLLTVVGLRAWVPLAALGGLCAAAVAWAVFGRIPVTVEGLGVLVNPGNVRPLQAPTNGQLIELRLRVGQHVARGDVVAVLNQPELRQELDQEQVRRRELREDHKLHQGLDERRRELEKKAYLAQKKVLEEAIGKSDRLLQSLAGKQQDYSQAQRDNLDSNRKLTSQLTDSLRTRLDSVRALSKEKLVPADTVFQAESAYTQHRLEMANLDVRLFELNTREMENAQNNLQQQTRISDLEIQLKQAEIKEETQQEEFVNNQTRREREYAEQGRKIERLKLTLGQKTDIVSEYGGRVLEIGVSPGHLLAAGEPLARVECDDPGAELKTLAYFEVQDGKKVREAMAARVTPTTVQRERYGSILGTVRKVSSFPITRQGAVNMVGSEEIAGSLTRASAMIETEIDLERDEAAPSGFRWTSGGPPLQFSAGTTTKVRITVEERAPITFVLPILESWVFGSDEDKDKPQAK